MTTQDLIDFSLSSPEASLNLEGTLIYWDTQDPDNHGPAYRIRANGEDIESGPLEHRGWSGPAEGYHLSDYFGGNGEYLGPDYLGVYPLLYV